MGWVNTAGSALWRAGASLVQTFRPRASDNQLREYATLEEMWQDLHGTGGRALSSAGVVVSPIRAMQCATVYSCVRVRREMIAQCPVEVFYREVSADGRKTRTPALDRPEYRVLTSRPNDWQTAFEFWEMVSQDLDLRGNSYALMVRNALGQVIELIWIHPDHMTPKQDRRTLAVTYEYRRPDGTTIVFKRSDILHVRGASGDGLKGLSPITDHARESIGLALATEQHGATFFGNGARPGSVLMAAGVMGPEAKQALREDWEDMYRGSSMANRVAILPDGVKFEPLHVSNEEAQFLETRKYQRSEICGIYRVPPHMVGDLERATFTNIEHQGIEAVGNVRPTARRIQQAVHRDVFDSDPRMGMVFDLSDQLRGDAKTFAEAQNVKRRAGVINANEWREDDGMNPRTDPGGEEYIVESNMAPQTGGMPEDQTGGRA